MSIWTETKRVTPENVHHFIPPESDPADLEIAQQILAVLIKHGIRSTPCEEGVFEGDLSQWSLGPRRSFTNYEQPAPVGFYADGVVSPYSDPGFDEDEEYQADHKQLLERVLPVVAELECKGIYCRPSHQCIRALLKKS